MTVFDLEKDGSNEENLGTDLNLKKDKVNNKQEVSLSLWFLVEKDGIETTANEEFLVKDKRKCIEWMSSKLFMPHEKELRVFLRTL